MARRPTWHIATIRFQDDLHRYPGNRAQSIGASPLATNIAEGKALFDCTVVTA
jgi:hypothetical protein